jgi:hypothetical protein
MTALVNVDDLSEASHFTSGVMSTRLSQYLTGTGIITVAANKFPIFAEGIIASNKTMGKTLDLNTIFCMDCIAAK